MQLPAYRYWCKVVSVHDGDTLTVDIDTGFRGRRQEDIRLLNCWAKELSETGGKSSKQHLLDLLKNYPVQTLGGYSEEPYKNYLFILETFKRPRAGTDLISMSRFIGVLYGKDSNGLFSINDRMIEDKFATRNKM